MERTQMIVGQGLIVRNGRVLVGLRNSPNHPTAHRRWELPSGMVEFGETLEAAIIREVREETGYHVKLTSELARISSVIWKHKSYTVQVILITYLCKIVAGRLGGDKEHLAWKWVTKADTHKLKLSPGTSEVLKWWFYERQSA